MQLVYGFKDFIRLINADLAGRGQVIGSAKDRSSWQEAAISFEIEWADKVPLQLPEPPPMVSVEEEPAEVAPPQPNTFIDEAVAGAQEPPARKARKKPAAPVQERPHSRHYQKRKTVEERREAVEQKLAQVEAAEPELPKKDDFADRVLAEIEELKKQKQEVVAQADRPL